MPTLKKPKIKRKNSLKPVIVDSLSDVAENKQRLNESPVRQKHSEKALSKSFIRYEDIFSEAIEGIYCTSAEGNLLRTNPAMAKMLGYASPEEAVRMITDTTKHVWADPGVRPAFVQQLQEKGLVRGFECQFLKKDGQRVWVSLNTRAIKGPGGEISHFEGFVEDITERKRGEEALRESEEKFRTTFEQAAVGIAHISPEGHFLRINQRFCDILGYSCEEMLGRTFQDVTYPDDLPTDLKQVGRLLSGKIHNYSMEKRYVRKDGSLTWVQLTVALTRDEAARPRWFVSVVEDINEQKRTQKELEERCLFDKLLANISARFINVPIDRLDREIEAAQKDICESLGLDICVLWQYTPEHPKNLRMTHRYAPLDFHLEVQANMDGSKIFPWSYEKIMNKETVALSRIADIPKEGACDIQSSKHFGIKSSLTFPLFVGGGPTFGALSFNAWREECRWPTDMIGKLRIVSQIFANVLNRRIYIAEQDKVAQEMLRLRDELMHVSRAVLMGELSASLSHETNQPLTAILSNAQAAQRLLARENYDLQEIREILEDIIRDSSRAGAIIAKLRAMVGNIKPEMRRIKLKNTIEEIVFFTRNHLTLKGVSLDLRFEDPSIEINADRVLFQQMILNIIMNSCDAMENSATKEICVSVDRISKDRVIISIADTGPGFPPEAESTFFKAFYSTKKTGMGMGLSISRRIADAHEGKIRTENRCGSGAVVLIELPVFEKAPS